MFVGLAATRFLHFAAISLLFGLAAYPFYVPRGEFGRPLRLAVKGCAFAGLLTGALELLAMAGNMGAGWSSAIDPSILFSAVTDTGYGRVWAARLVLALLTTGAALTSRSGRSVTLLVASAILLASVALTGHSAMPGGPIGVVHQVADAMHLLAAGWWIGGLLALVLMARRFGTGAPAVLARFSRIGYVAVALLILSGVLKAVLLIGRPGALFTTAYGQVLILKLALFAGMGVLALSNRFQLTPALASGAEPNTSVRRLRAQVTLEFCLSLMILAAVGALGAMEPPVS